MSAIVILAFLCLVAASVVLRVVLFFMDGNDHAHLQGSRRSPARSASCLCALLNGM
jgi:hypothetical protein